MTRTRVMSQYFVNKSKRTSYKIPKFTSSRQYKTPAEIRTNWALLVSVLRNWAPICTFKDLLIKTLRHNLCPVLLTEKDKTSVKFTMDTK